MFKNIFYFGYYIIKTPWRVFIQNVSFISKKCEITGFKVAFDVFRSSLIYNMSFMDFFLLRFYKKNESERAEYAGTGFMYEYQLKMNPKNVREVLSDKIEFFKHYRKFVGRKWFQLKDLNINNLEIIKFLENSEKIVLKNSRGQAGKEVEVITKLPFDKLKQYMVENDFDLIEEFVYQHSEIQSLAPKGLNTIRIITQLKDDGSVDVLGATLRLSVDSSTDNLSSGNIAAAVDINKGVVYRKAVFGDFKMEDIAIHPVSGKSIVGFKIPYWEECLSLVVNAAQDSKGNKSIGWDVAVTDVKPILIEGNHNWGRTLWQLPVDKGLKHLLVKYL